ncbi:hypothetical protein WJ970_21155 [Achromobacter xylosoxidans]
MQTPAARAGLYCDQTLSAGDGLSIDGNCRRLEGRPDLDGHAAT